MNIKCIRHVLSELKEYENIAGILLKSISSIFLIMIFDIHIDIWIALHINNLVCQKYDRK